MANEWNRAELLANLSSRALNTSGKHLSRRQRQRQSQGPSPCRYARLSTAEAAPPRSSLTRIVCAATIGADRISTIRGKGHHRGAVKGVQRRSTELERKKTALCAQCSNWARRKYSFAFLVPLLSGGRREREGKGKGSERGDTVVTRARENRTTTSLQ